MSVCAYWPWSCAEAMAGSITIAARKAATHRLMRRVVSQGSGIRDQGPGRKSFGGDFRTLARHAEPLAVAIDEDVHEARHDLGRFALDRPDHALGEPDDSRFVEHLDGEVIDCPLVHLLIEGLDQLKFAHAVGAVAVV